MKLAALSARPSAVRSRPVAIMLGIGVCTLLAAGWWASIGSGAVGDGRVFQVQTPSVLWVSDPEGISDDAAAHAAVTLSGDGLFQVGADFPAGVYRSAGPRSATACQWARLVTPPVGQSAVKETASSAGQQVVTVRSSDTALFSVGCLPWTRIG